MNDESILLRHLSLAFCVVGAIAALAAGIWNRSGSFPVADGLTQSHAELVEVRVQPYRSKTAIAKFVVVDVLSQGKPEIWVLPSFSQNYLNLIGDLDPGGSVTGGLLPEERLARWTDDPIRVLWSLEYEGEDRLPYALVLETERAKRRFSPVVGAMVLGLGVVLGLVSRRLSAKEE
jgi:hypothetical protein